MKLVLAATAPAGVLVEIAPIAPLPDALGADEFSAHMVSAMTRNLPAGATLVPRAEGDREDKTTLGWPMRVREAAVVAGEVVVERRVGAFYELGEWSGFIIARMPVGAAVTTDAVVALLASAHPVWTSRAIIAALSELWS